MHDYSFIVSIIIIIYFVQQSYTVKNVEVQPIWIYQVSSAALVKSITLNLNALSRMHSVIISCLNSDELDELDSN